MDSKDYAREVIRHEAEMIAALAERVGENFNLAVEMIQDCKGRVIVAGMGKSGLIARKIAATFNSTGISSFFLHPAEALHGDLGLMQAKDVLMFLSKSGRLHQMEEIIGVARRLGVKIIVLGGTVDSPLYQRADIALDCSVASEACQNNLVPTSSSTAALVMGDALALALLKARNFSPSDFAVLHPAGALGQRLLRRVLEFCHTGDEIPLVTPEASLSEMIVQMTGKRLGCVLLKNGQERVAGIFTDGDLRRLIEKDHDSNLFSLKASDVMTRMPKTIDKDAVLDRALAIMEKHTITQLAVLDDDERLVGVLHLHDILKSKLV